MVKSAKIKTSKRPNGKAKLTPETFQDYVVGVPEEARGTLMEIREAILAVLPAKATETISYGIPAFRHDGRVLVWYAGFAKHCSLFPTATIIAAFKKELAGYSTSKGTIHFPTDKRAPAALIKKLVKARVVEMEKKRKS
jgi:uncharacterized protein YdhG (YjbR/CyaY superfamily)